MLCGASCWRGCWCEVGVACEPPVALPQPLRFPGCEGLLMCPPNPAPGGSNLGRAPKVLLPASVADPAAIRCLALGGLPSAQQECRAYLWLNETDTVHQAGQAPALRNGHIRLGLSWPLAWVLVPTQTCVGGGGLRWGPSALWVDSSLWACHHCIASVGGSSWRPLGSEAGLLAWGAPALCSPAWWGRLWCPGSWALPGCPPTVNGPA